MLEITALNVYKPSGLSPYGWRKQLKESGSSEKSRPFPEPSGPLAAVCPRVRVRPIDTNQGGTK
jgi:hypothetical protein